MDPLSAGANVVAFLGLALKSAQTINHVFSAVKDGPRYIQNLIDEVSQLQIILERLLQIQAGQVSETGLTDLAVPVKKCVDDVASLELKLQRLDLSGTDRKAGKLWRRIKAAMTEKDLERMRDIIRGHVLMLNFQLGIAQTTKLTLSTTQSTEILELLRQLKADVSKCHGAAASANIGTVASENLGATGTGGEDEGIPVIDSALEESISRLIELVKEKECTIESDDAEQLLTDLQTLLGSVAKEETLSTPPVISSNFPGDFQLKTEQYVSKELKLINNLMFSAPLIAINTNDAIRHIPHGTITSQQRKRKSFNTGSGVLTLSTNKRRRTYFNEQFGDETNNTCFNGGEFIAKVLFKPKDFPCMVTVSVNQSQTPYGSLLSIPRLSACNILQMDSPVFKLAASGQVEALMKLVRDGEASLRDHDERGWSLLHYAIEHPRMCQFLIQNGLDVDEVGASPYNRQSQITPLHRTYIGGLHRTAPILLEAGADPTLQVHGWNSFSHIVSSEHEFTYECMLKQIFALSSHFEPLRFTDEFGMTVFLMACTPGNVVDFDPERHIRKLAFLLDRGSGIDETDIYGSNCLIRYFIVPVLSPREQNWKKSLIYLVQRGADVYARNLCGASVSHLAYRKLYDDTSYAGDLWDVVLDACGYDVLEFRRGYPRKARYSEVYTRHDFELLWEGQEHRCPYWNDTEWPISDEMSNEEDTTNNRTVVCHVEGCYCNTIYLYGYAGNWTDEDCDSGMEHCTDTDSAYIWDDSADEEDEPDMAGLLSGFDDADSIPEKGSGEGDMSSLDNTMHDISGGIWEEDTGYTIPPSVWQHRASPTTEGQIESDFNSQNQRYFQYTGNTFQQDELFYSPWNDEQARPATELDDGYE